MRRRSIFLFLISIFGVGGLGGLSREAHAETWDAQRLSRWVKSQYLVDFPQSVQTAFFESIDEIRVDASDEWSECVRVESSWFWKKTLAVRFQCLQAEDFQKKPTPTRFHRDLFQTVIRVWMKHKEMDRDHMASKIAIRNYFFETGTSLFEPQVNLDQSLARSIEDFWVKITWKAMTDSSELQNKHPQLYLFLSEYFFENGLRFQNDSASRFWRFSEGKVRYLKTNTEAWYARYFLVQGAKYRIHAQYFILEDDIFGLSFLEMLRQKAMQGVRVKLMVDVRGTLAMATRPWQMSLLAALADQGVEVKFYNSWLFSGSMGSPFVANHDKILLVDGREFIVGGRNISKDYLLEPEDHPRVFEDGDVLGSSEVEAMRLLVAFNEEFYGGKNSTIRDWASFASPVAVNRLKNALPAMEEWMFTSMQSSAAIDRYPELKNYPRLKQFDFGELLWGGHSYWAKIKVVDSTSKFDQRNDIIDALFFMMETAQKRIWIHTPYLVLTERLRETLTRASQRGVKIKITTNSRESTDNPFPVSVFEGEWRGIYRDMPTLELYTVKGPARLHQKIFVFDDDHSIVSSYNFDTMSEKRNSEVGLYVNSMEFNQDISEWMEHYTSQKAVLLPRPQNPFEPDEQGLFYYLLNLFRRYL